jgi:hypothetical protein
MGNSVCSASDGKEENDDASSFNVVEKLQAIETAGDVAKVREFAATTHTNGKLPLQLLAERGDVPIEALVTLLAANADAAAILDSSTGQ